MCPVVLLPQRRSTTGFKQNGSDKMSEIVLEMRNVNKSFPGVRALKNVCFQVNKGEVHAIVGENGAGKSTLMKVLNGVYQAESGEIFIEGKQVQIHGIHEAQELGISLIFQENNLLPNLSVAENFFLGAPVRTKAGFIDWKTMQKKAAEIFQQLNYQIDPKELVVNLSAADKQMVEVARAISKNAKIIVMDEPTSSLTTVETEKLFTIIRDLKAKGTTIIFISHKMDEIFAIADRISIQRDGEMIHTAPVSELTRERIVELMVGRTIDAEFPQRKSEIGEVVLEARGVCRKNLIEDVSVTLHRGEILGFAGLVGAGRTEFAETIFGEGKLSGGEILLHGKKVSIRNTSQAIRASIGMLTEERKETGLALQSTVKANIVISKLEKICLGGVWLSKAQEKQTALKYVKDLNIKTPSINQTAYNLSGGNQQKIAIAKWLFSDADILIFDEPTRGIDVGAKYEIYHIMNDLVSMGKSIIFISSELPELMGMSDRIVVMHEGRKKGELLRDEFSAEGIMALAVS